MHPNPNGEYPNYQQPQFAPPAGGQTPQWEQPQSVPQQVAPVYQPPVPGTENYPAGPAQTAQEIRPPEVNTSSFIPDTKTREILDRTYPELTNALINLAIKKYSEDTDYANYFVREEFKEQVEHEQPIQKTQEKKEVPITPGADFSTW